MSAFVSNFFLLSARDPFTEVLRHCPAAGGGSPSKERLMVTKLDFSPSSVKKPLQQQVKKHTEIT
jgi:hypothetical protein